MPFFIQKLLHSTRQALLPFVLFASAIVALGCQPTTSSTDNNLTAHEPDQQQVDSSAAPPVAGNAFYMMRDVAEVQLKVGENINALQDTSQQLNQAVHSQDLNAAHRQRDTLVNELQSLHNNLTQIELRSQEVSQLRAQLLKTTDDLLASKWLDTTLSLQESDLKQLQQQLFNIQNSMLNIASLVMQDPNKAQADTTE